MLGFNHTLAGSIIGVVVPVPAIPFVALASHFILDAMPHYGNDNRILKGSRGFHKLLALDGLLCFLSMVFAILLFPNLWLQIGFGVLFSVLPDFLWLFKTWLHTPSWILHFMDWVQWGERPWGYILEIIYAVIFLATILVIR